MGGSTSWHEQVPRLCPGSDGGLTLGLRLVDEPAAPRQEEAQEAPGALINKILHTCSNFRCEQGFVAGFLQKYIFFAYFARFQAIKGEIPAFLQD